MVQSVRKISRRASTGTTGATRTKYHRDAIRDIRLAAVGMSVLGVTFLIGLIFLAGPAIDTTFWQCVDWTWFQSNDTFAERCDTTCLTH